MKSTANRKLPLGLSREEQVVTDRKALDEVLAVEKIIKDGVKNLEANRAVSRGSNN